MIVHVFVNWILNFIIILKQRKMVIKHSFTIRLLLMYAPIMGTISTSTTSSSTEGSISGMSSVTTMSPQTTTSQSPTTTTQLGSSFNAGTKHSEPVSKTTWQEPTSSSPGTNVVTGGGTAHKPMPSARSLCLCSVFTLLCILRQKWAGMPAHCSPS